ncbi:MAG: Uma2 family endonuclease [Cyanobacteria bacterium J06639_1]
MSSAIALNVEALALTDEQFFRLCADNRDLRFERSATGALTIMSPTGGETGNRNGRLTQQLFNWSDRDGTGIAFDSSTGFHLPNGADRSPDAAWMSLSRWQTLTPEQQTRFVPLCPDYVVELLSPSDNLTATRAKMQEYVDNGIRLGWLIRRRDRQVDIYRQGERVVTLENPSTISGAPVLSGFTLDLQRIW